MISGGSSVNMQGKGTTRQYTTALRNPQKAVKGSRYMKGSQGVHLGRQLAGL